MHHYSSETAKVLKPTYLKSGS